MKNKHYIIIGLLFLLSFRFYSSIYYPILNTDNAVTILMIHYFELPNDLYFWGQDRMGSLIPLLAQIPFKIFNISALTSESVVHYLILLLGFLSFSYFIKSKFLKIIFAIIWFFPPMRLIDVTQFSFGIHYSLIGISCYLFDYSRKIKKHNQFIKYVLILILIAILLSAAIWVSDMAMISVFLFIAVQLYLYVKNNNSIIHIYKNVEFYITIIGVIFCYLFISYAKKTASNQQDYSTFSEIETITKTLNIFTNSVLDFFKFKTDEPFTSVYSYLVLVLFILVISQFKKIRTDTFKNIWFILFLLDALCLFAVIMISKWTYLNGVPRRYFTCTYISFSFTIILILDNINFSKKIQNVTNILIFTTVIIGGLGALYNIKYIWPKTMKPRVEYSKEFESLGNIGVISEYWNSYITSCTNPELIKATPHDTSWAVRNYKIVDEVFNQDNIYIIRDMWFETFPDTAKQFGRVLIKNGDEFKIGDCKVCNYNLVK